MEGLRNSMDGGGHSGGFFEFFFYNKLLKKIDLFDILNMFGGGGHKGSNKQQVRKNKAVKKELKITLENAYKGDLIKIPHTCTRVCTGCEGKGGKNEKTCPTCKGRGVVEKLLQLGPGMFQQMRSHCSECGGEGKSVSEKDRCKKCKGEKISQVSKVLEVPIEKGVPEKFVITMHGEGDELVKLLLSIEGKNNTF